MSFLRKIDIKHFMIFYLTFLILYVSILFDNYFAILSSAVIIILYVLCDLCWTYWRHQVWYVPLSSVISGLVISMVTLPDPTLAPTIFLPFIAVISKHLFNFGKERHLFNPAAFSLAVASLLLPLIAWWGPSFSRIPQSFAGLADPDQGFILFCILVIGGLFILWRQNKWLVAVAFFSAQAFFLILISLADGVYLQVFDLLSDRLINGVTIFFATVMLVEPMTSMFNDWKNEFIYGFIVGVVSIAIVYVEKNFGFISIDTLVFGLLVGNFIAGILFLPQKKVAPLPLHRV